MKVAGGGRGVQLERSSSLLSSRCVCVCVVRVRVYVLCVCVCMCMCVVIVCVSGILLGEFGVSTVGFAQVQLCRSAGMSTVFHVREKE